MHSVCVVFVVVTARQMARLTIVQVNSCYFTNYEFFRIQRCRENNKHSCSRTPFLCIGVQRQCTLIPLNNELFSEVLIESSKIIKKGAQSQLRCCVIFFLMRKHSLTSFHADIRKINKINLCLVSTVSRLT